MHTRTQKNKKHAFEATHHNVQGAVALCPLIKLLSEMSYSLLWALCTNKTEMQFITTVRLVICLTERQWSNWEQFKEKPLSIHVSTDLFSYCKRYRKPAVVLTSVMPVKGFFNQTLTCQSFIRSFRLKANIGLIEWFVYGFILAVILFLNSNWTP